MGQAGPAGVDCKGGSRGPLWTGAESTGSMMDCSSRGNRTTTTGSAKGEDQLFSDLVGGVGFLCG